MKTFGHNKAHYRHLMNKRIIAYLLTNKQTEEWNESMNVHLWIIQESQNLVRHLRHQNQVVQPILPIQLIIFIQSFKLWIQLVQDILRPSKISYDILDI